MYFNLNSLTFASPMVCVSLLDTCDYILFTLIHLTPELLDLSEISTCLLYTSDAADDMQCVDLGGRRIIKK